MKRFALHLALVLAASACSSPAPAPAETRPVPAPAPAPEPEGPPAPPEPPPLPEAAGVHYLEITTGGANPEDPLPMIVAIHGLGDDPRGFVGLVADLGVPARVVLPRGIDPHEPGWSWFPQRARDEDVAALSAGIENGAERVAAAIAELRKSKPTVGEPIVTGFSQGGMLTFTLAVHHPEVVGAAFPVGGWLPPPLWPEHRPDGAPTIRALHGEADNAVPFPPTQEAVEKLKAVGFDAQLQAYPDVQHMIPPPMRSQLHELLRAAVENAVRSG